MAVVSHRLKLADGRKWQSRASRWLSLTCHLNGLVQNQINRWLQTLRSRGSYFVYALEWGISKEFEEVRRTKNIYKSDVFFYSIMC